MTQRMAKRALRHLVLEHLLWLGGILETVILIEVVWWARVSSSDNYMRDHWVVLDMLRCLRTPPKARVKESCTWLLDVPYECLPHCSEEVLVFHQLLVVPQT